MLSAKSGARGSVLDKLRVAGSLKAVFPRPIGQALDVVMVNTAGGITGGDHFDLQAEAAAGTALTLTTQAAERAYRAQQGSVGRLETHLRVGADARLHWLPQETILFNGSALQRDLRVDISGGSTFLLCEPLVFGRAAMGEVLDLAYFRDTIDIRRDGKRVFL
ncbi:MAG TPA: urease accessory protein UreD, partial [Paracoccaceae bacterium]|nr:urease accessory protein UreD [Paracoccaceae bacterium]